MEVSWERMGGSGSSVQWDRLMCQRLISRSLLAENSTISFAGTLGAEGKLSGSMARNCTAFAWPLSLCKALPVLRSQRIIVASAEPESKTGVPESVVVRRHLTKSACPVKVCVCPLSKSVQ